MLRALDEVEGLDWIRLLYLYPTALTDELIEVLASSKRVLPYVDVPLQHASDRLLALMKRGSTEARQRRLVERLREGIPNVTLRTTYMVGFPGEDEEDFARLCDFVRETRFDRVGVFRYSDEEGTAAYGLPGKVPRTVARQRYHRLLEIQREIMLEKLESKVGEVSPVLVDAVIGGGLAQARLPSQAPEIDGVVFLKGDVQPGDLVDARITGVREVDLEAELVRGRGLSPLLPPVAPRQQIGLAAPLAAGLGPDLPRLGEAAADALFEGLGLGAVEELDESQTPGQEELRQRRLDGPEQRLFPRPVAGANAGQLGRGIAEQDVGAAPQKIQKYWKNRGIREIPRHREDVFELQGRIDGRQIHPGDTPAGAYVLRRHLEPSARPTAQIDDALTFPEDPLGSLDLRQLVGRPRGVSLALGALVEGILALIGQELAASRHGVAHADQAVVVPGDGAADHQQVSLRIHPHHLEVADGHPRVAHAAEHAHPLDDLAGVGARPDRAGVAEGFVGPVGPSLHRKVVALHHACGAPALGGADHVHLLAGLEDVRLEGASDLVLLESLGIDPTLTDVPLGRHARLLEVTQSRLREGLAAPLAIAQLEGGVAVLFLGLLLDRRYWVQPRAPSRECNRPHR